MQYQRSFQLRDDRTTTLKNRECAYCGVPLTAATSTREHVIGRQFVPKGTMSKAFNLVVMVCATCNNLKSGLEDDIAAITMNLHLDGPIAMRDPVLQQEARRRAHRCKSRKTGKSIRDSREGLDFELPLHNGGSLSGNFVAPPQFEDARADRLAQMQMAGFFFMLTYDSERNRGYCWPGGFFPVHGAIKTDWGNPIHRSFMETIETWDYRLILITADGYYRALIRKHPTSACWGWAVEWNCSYRLVGFFGDPVTSRELRDKMPPLRYRSIYEGVNQFIRMTADVPLDEHEDTLFRMPD